MTRTLAWIGRGTTAGIFVAMVAPQISIWQTLGAIMCLMLFVDCSIYLARRA